MEKIPLFPLGVVLFPEGRIPLQIFEPRYLDLVKRCLREDCGFGVVLIREGRDTVWPGAAAMPKLAPLGTLARIVDWDALPNGRLGITVEGQRKFRLLSTEQQDDFLVWGEVEWLPDDTPVPLPVQADELVSLLQRLMAHPAIARLRMRNAVSDAGVLGNLLAQCLPIAEQQKFALLAESDPVHRLDRLVGVLDQYQ